MQEVNVSGCAGYIKQQTAVLHINLCAVAVAVVLLPFQLQQSCCAEFLLGSILGKAGSLGQVCSGSGPEPVVGCAVVVAARTGAGQSVAVLWIQSWAEKSEILAKVLSPAEREREHKITSNRGHYGTFITSSISALFQANGFMSSFTEPQSCKQMSECIAQFAFIISSNGIWVFAFQKQSCMRSLTPNNIQHDFTEWQGKFNSTQNLSPPLLISGSIRVSCASIN